MSIVKYSIVFLSLFHAAGLRSQDSIRNKSYFDFLRHPDSTSQSHLITASYQYMLSPVGKTLGAQGLITNVGLNFSRFFSDKFVLGICADLKYIPGISTKNARGNFVKDFNDSFIPTYGTPLDSANAYVVKYAINSDGSHFAGNNVFNVGVMVSPFPQKYGGLLLQVKWGSNGYNIHGRIFENKFIQGGGRDFYTMGVTGNWTYELTIKPYAFFDNSYLNKDDYEPADIWKGFIISFYYQRLNFRSAEFNGTRVSDMVNTEFMKKYGIDNRFGVKLGISLY